MAQTITNQARLNFRYNDQNGSVLSNIATAILAEPLVVDKNSIESTYRPGDELTFVVSFTGSSASSLTNVIVTDDLGAYPPGTGTEAPFDFISPAIYYVNGNYAGTLTADMSADGVSFNIPSVAAGAGVVIIYKAGVNENAPIAAGSSITNTASVTADGLSSPVTASSTVTAEDYADVRITKTMTPASVADGDLITYEFDIFNYGNTEATNVVLIDQFDPAPANIMVQINGDTIDPSNYTYVGGLLTLPAGTAELLSLPAAAITQDPVTGEVTIVPSAITITVTGII